MREKWEKVAALLREHYGWVFVGLAVLCCVYTIGYCAGLEARGRAIIITDVAQSALPEGTPTPSREPEYPININTADAETLTFLPGVGQALAERIVAYRQENGDFAAVEDIMQVYGIGEKKYNAMKNLITVEERQDEDTGR